MEEAGAADLGLARLLIRPPPIKTIISPLPSSYQNMEEAGAAGLGRGAGLPPDQAPTKKENDQAPYLYHPKKGGERDWPGPWGWPAS
eukprot:1160787-Pelagomonas_calceolata.AAC.7